MTLPLRLRRAARLTREIVWLADTSSERWLIALTSVLWGAVLLWGPAIFERASYRLVVLIAELPLGWLGVGRWLEPQAVWGLAFVAHGVASWWRIYDGRPSRAAALAVNLSGFALWAISSVSIASIGTAGPGVVAALVLSVRLLVIAWRSGLNDEVTSP